MSSCNVDTLFTMSVSSLGGIKVNNQDVGHKKMDYQNLKGFFFFFFCLDILKNAFFLTAERDEKIAIAAVTCRAAVKQLPPD